ncbi:hypothetical protein BASA82_000351 [Batrachochytrium salamandrivorans]|nr:hypothetical protein BASA82_000351 [Batrachochytrium salamandrivorans]
MSSSGPSLRAVPFLVHCLWKRTVGKRCPSCLGIRPTQLQPRHSGGDLPPGGAVVAPDGGAVPVPLHERAQRKQPAQEPQSGQRAPAGQNRDQVLHQGLQAGGLAGAQSAYLCDWDGDLGDYLVPVHHRSPLQSGGPGNGTKRDRNGGLRLPTPVVPGRELHSEQEEAPADL